MIRRLAAAGLLAALLALGTAGAASAGPEMNEQAVAGHDEEEAPKIDAGKLALQFVNFAVLVGVLVYFGRKPLRQALQARHEQLKADLAAAAEARTAAAARLDKQNARLASLEQEIADIRAGIKQEAEAEKARLIAMAEERAKRIREESEFMIEQQVKQAEEDLRRETAAAAVALAEKIVRSQLGAADQQRLIDTFVGDVASPNGARPAPPYSGPNGASGLGAPRSEI